MIDIVRAKSVTNRCNNCCHEGVCKARKDMDELTDQMNVAIGSMLAAGERFKEANNYVESIEINCKCYLYRTPMNFLGRPCNCE